VACGTRDSDACGGMLSGAAVRHSSLLSFGDFPDGDLSLSISDFKSEI